MSPTDHIIDGNKVTDRFGRWPSFHDCEVVSVTLDRRGPTGPRAEMLIHAWLMTSQVDARGYYVLEKHSLVRFAFEHLLSSEFSNFNHQNCLSSLWVEDEQFEGKPAMRVNFPTNFGLEGFAVCHRVIVLDVRPCDVEGNSGEG